MRTIEEFEATTIHKQAEALEWKMLDAIAAAVDPDIAAENGDPHEMLFQGDVDEAKSQVIHEAIVRLTVSLMTCNMRGEDVNDLEAYAAKVTGDIKAIFLGSGEPKGFTPTTLTGTRH